MGKAALEVNLIVSSQRVGLGAEHYQLIVLIGQNVQPVGRSSGDEDADIGHTFDYCTHDVACQLLLDLHPRFWIELQKTR